MLYINNAPLASGSAGSEKAHFYYKREVIFLPNVTCLSEMSMVNLDCGDRRKGICASAMAMTFTGLSRAGN